MLFNNAGAKHLKHYWNRLKVKADDLFDQVGSDSSRPDPYSAAAWQRGFTSSHHLFISPPLPLLPPSHPAFSSYLLFRPLCSGDILFFFFLSFFLKNPHITVCFAQKHTFHPRAFIWKGKWLSGQEKHFWQRKCRASFSLRWNRKPCCLPFLCLCYTYACMESSWGDGWLEVGCLWYRDRQRSIIYGGGKKSCLLCLVSYVKANIYFTPLDHTRRSSHA